MNRSIDPIGTPLDESTNTVAMAELSAHPTYTLIEFTFTGNILLSAGTHYCIMLYAESATLLDTSNNVATGADNSTPTHDGNASWYSAGWIFESGVDLCFYVYGISGVTLDGRILDVLEFSEGADPVQSQWDAWQNSTYKREIKVYGVEGTWRLTCVEKDVEWANSQPKAFEDAAEAGDPVAFVVTDEERAVNTTVFILAVSVHFADVAGRNIRYFTLTLQEV